MQMQNLAFILLSSWLVLAKAAPSRSYRLAYYNAPAKIKGLERVDDYISPAISDDNDYEDEYSIASSRKTSNPATGRLFFNKLFNNNNSNRQPIIPIIVTGAGGNNNAATSVTTATIPQATGTITTSPVVARGQMEGEEEEEDGDASTENGMMKDEELQKQQAALQNAIAAAAQEYVVANGPINAADTDVSDQIKVREQEDKNKFITVRVPAKYRKFFKKGQKVYLRRPNSNSNNSNNNRRRRNRNRNRRVRN